MGESLPPSRAELNSGDKKILNKIKEELHTPSHSNLDSESLLSVVTDFLNGTVMGKEDHLDKMEDKYHKGDLGVPSRLIEKLCCEMKCGCMVSKDEQLRETTLSMFSKLSGYSWESKAVLALFAYAIKYGDFLLLDQVYQEHQNDQKLVKPMRILKKLVVDTNPPDQSGLPKKEIGEITSTILEVTKFTVQIQKLLVNNNPDDLPPLFEARDKLPMAVYLTIKTIIACASQFSSLTTTTHVSHLSTLHDELSDMLKYLLLICDKFSVIAEKEKEKEKEKERYQRYLRLWELLVFPRGEVDYVEALKALIYTNDGMLTKTSTDKKTQVIKIQELQNMGVLLFISGLYISTEELTILKKTYDDSRADKERRFEMVWVPVVEQWTAEAKNKYEVLKAEITWYTVQNFSGTDGAVIKFLKKAWHFHVKPIVIVLNHEGKVESENAIHMINVWGWEAFPFTETKQKELSKKISKFTLDVIFKFEDVDSQVTRLIKQNEFILLYGGTETNTEWIEKLKQEARAFFMRTETCIKFVNVQGNSRFWSRLESFLFSRMHMDYDKVDEVFHEIQKLFGYNKLGKWAMLSKGPNVVISGHADTFLPVFSREKSVSDKNDLVQIITELHKGITTHDPKCYHYWLQAVSGKVPESLKCLMCERTMKKYVTFECCHEDEGAVSNFH